MSVITAAAGMEHISYAETDKIEHIVYSLLDIKSENIGKHFNPIHELIEDALSKGSVLVHCAAGVSRVLFYLISQLPWWLPTLWNKKDGPSERQSFRLENNGWKFVLTSASKGSWNNMSSCFPRKNTKSSQEKDRKQANNPNTLTNTQKEYNYLKSVLWEGHKSKVSSSIHSSKKVQLE